LIKSVGLAVKVAIPVVLLFGALSAYDNGWCVGALTGVRGGALLGLGAVLINAVYEWFARDRQVSFPGETALKSDAAQELVGSESAAGRLYLTTKALHFRSDRSVQQPQNWSIRLADVTGVEATRAFGIIPSGFTITTSTNTIRLVVSGNSGWVAAISSAKDGCVSEGSA
jgi:hypothetical protein